MNRDEILKMEAGPEINRLVYIYVMGWGEQAWIESRDSYIFRPSEEIKWTWMVVDALSKRNIHFAIFTQNNVVMTFEGKFDGGYISEAGGADDSIECAICRAALLAVMEVNG